MFLDVLKVLLQYLLVPVLDDRLGFAHRLLPTQALLYDR